MTKKESLSLLPIGIADIKEPIVEDAKLRVVLAISVFTSALGEGLNIGNVVDEIMDAQAQTNQLIGN